MGAGKFSGTLEVTLVGASLFDDELLDSYATVGYATQQFTTPVAKGSQPCWNKRFTFDLEESEPEIDIYVEIFGVLPELDKLLGLTRIRLSKNNITAAETSHYVLTKPKEGESGQVTIQFKWIKPEGFDSYSSSYSYSTSEYKPTAPSSYPPVSGYPSVAGRLDSSFASLGILQDRAAASETLLHTAAPHWSTASDSDKGYSSSSSYLYLTPPQTAYPPPPPPTTATATAPIKDKSEIYPPISTDTPSPVHFEGTVYYPPPPPPAIVSPTEEKNSAASLEMDNSDRGLGDKQDKGKHGYGGYGAPSGYGGYPPPDPYAYPPQQHGYPPVPPPQYGHGQPGYPPAGYPPSGYPPAGYAPQHGGGYPPAGHSPFGGGGQGGIAGAIAHGAYSLMGGGQHGGGAHGGVPPMYGGGGHQMYGHGGKHGKHGKHGGYGYGYGGHGGKHGKHKHGKHGKFGKWK